jgi:hypothetical protein
MLVTFSSTQPRGSGKAKKTKESEWINRKGKKKQFYQLFPTNYPIIFPQNCLTAPPENDQQFCQLFPTNYLTISP